VASKTVKAIKVPGAKMPKMQASLPKAPKLPQLQQNLSPYAVASKATVPVRK
jgi:hypothetical protein